MHLFHRYWMGPLHMALSDRPFGPVSGASTIPGNPPLNTQAAQSGPLPRTLTLTSAAQTQVSSAELPGVPLFVEIPPATMLEQTVFDLWISGYIKTTAAGTITVAVFEGNSATIGNNTLLGTSGAVTQASATAAWFAHAQLIYDSVSGTLAGTIEFYIDRTPVAKVTLSNFPTNIGNLNNPVASFTLTVASSGATSGTPTTFNVQKFTVG